ATANLKDAHKAMAVGRAHLPAVTALLLAWHFTRPDPLAEEVDRLVASMATRGAQATIDDSWALGPRVIPNLARNARRYDTLLLKGYRFAQSKLPRVMQRWLKPPPDPG